MLDKPQFDCNDLGDFYDCGCEEHEASDTGEEEPRSKSQAANQREGHDGNTSPPVEISREASVSPGATIVNLT